MSELNEFQSIAEVPTGADFNESAKVMALVDSYFNAGWVLLGIHQRGWDNDTTCQTTVYILGHKEPHATHPGRFF